MGVRLTGPGVSTGKPGDLHTEARNVVGTERAGYDASGRPGVWIYLPGCTNGAAGKWVSFDEAFVTTLSAADAQGRLAVLSADADSTSEYCWAQIVGTVSAKALTGFVDNGKVYLTSTAGSMDDSDVGGDFVVGAIGRSAVNETTLLATFQIDRPRVQDTAFD